MTPAEFAGPHTGARSRLAWLMAALAALAIVSASFAQAGTYFWGNFLWYWLPGAMVVCILSVFRSSRASLCGATLALALFLFVYHAWMASLPAKDNNGLAWLGYLLAMPGLLAGALIGDGLSRRRLRRTAVAMAAGTVGSLAGLAVGMGVVCSTMMYCR